MTIEEQRQLEMQVGEKVFGLKPIHQDDPRTKEGTKAGFFVIEFIHVSKSLPWYSTDPVQTLRVIEWCAKHLTEKHEAASVAIYWNTEVDPPRWCASHDYTLGQWEGDTIGEAVCKLALHLVESATAIQGKD